MPLQVMGTVHGTTRDDNYKLSCFFFFIEILAKLSILCSTSNTTIKLGNRSIGIKLIIV